MTSCNRFVTKLSFMVRSGKMSCNLQEKAKDAKEFVHASADFLSRSCELRWDVPWRSPEVLSSLRSRLPFSCHSHALGDSRRVWVLPCPSARPSWPVRVFSVQTKKTKRGAAGRKRRNRRNRLRLSQRTPWRSPWLTAKKLPAQWWHQLKIYCLISLKQKWIFLDMPWFLECGCEVNEVDHIWSLYFVVAGCHGHSQLQWKSELWLSSHAIYCLYVDLDIGSRGGDWGATAATNKKAKWKLAYYIALICITRLWHDHVLQFFYDTKRKWTTCTWTLSPDTWIQILICDPLPHRMVWLAAAAIPWFLVSCLWASHCEMCEEFPVISHFCLSSETWLEGERQRARLHLNC